MQPNNPLPGPQPVPPANPYDFLSEQPKQSSGLIPKLPGGRRMLLLGGGVVFIIVAVFGLLALLGGGDPLQQQVISIAARQQEIVRVSEVATKNARASDTLVYASTVKATVQSQQNRLLTVATKKPDRKLLTSKRSETTDKALESARQANRFDETYIAYLKKELQAYQAEVKELHDAAQLPKTKAILSETFTSNGLILKNLR